MPKVKAGECFRGGRKTFLFGYLQCHQEGIPLSMEIASASMPPASGLHEARPSSAGHNFRVNGAWEQAEHYAKEGRRNREAEADLESWTGLTGSMMISSPVMGAGTCPAIGNLAIPTLGYGLADGQGWRRLANALTSDRGIFHRPLTGRKPLRLPSSRHS